MMRWSVKQWMAVVALMASLPALSQEWRDNAEVAALFGRAGVEGTFVLYDVARQQLTGHNQTRAGARFVPASTYKIPHTLIGLLTGAIASVDEVLPYGSQPQPYPDWERDMSLREAIVLSAVPIYQSLARRIGPEAMGVQLARLDYGNNQTGTQVDRFWLDGPLAISAIEQVQFIARLVADELPAPAQLQAATRDIVRLEAADGRTLYGKTGWENAPRPGVGWWVGWVETDAGIFPFALNMEMHSGEDAALRLELGKASLRALGVW